MDSMLMEDKNLKDSNIGTDIALKDSFISIPFSKTNKLITALYIVTDIMDKNEPLRNKLRTLGADMISDIISKTSTDFNLKIKEILSFLDIAFTVGMISEMNCNILKKEFVNLQKAIEDSKQITLSEFFENSPHPNPLLVNEREQKNSKGLSANLRAGQITNSIGVQRGGTLMKALRDKMSDRTLISNTTSKDNFDVLKKQRREEIIKVIKNKNNATITDIKSGAQGVLVSCGEKTLQRELVSMVKDDVLKKTGEKRWSRYFLPQ